MVKPPKLYRMDEKGVERTKMRSGHPNNSKHKPSDGAQLDVLFRQIALDRRDFLHLGDCSDGVIITRQFVDCIESTLLWHSQMSSKVCLKTKVCFKTVFYRHKCYIELQRPNC